MIVYAIKNKKGEYYNDMYYNNTEIHPEHWFINILDATLYEEYNYAKDDLKHCNTFQFAKIVKVKIEEVEE